MDEIFKVFVKYYGGVGFFYGFGVSLGVCV